MPMRIQDVASFASWFDDTRRIDAAFEQYGRATAERAHPDHALARGARDRAAGRRDDAGRAYQEAAGDYSRALSGYGRLSYVDDPAGRLAETDQSITTLRRQADAARTRRRPSRRTHAARPSRRPHHRRTRPLARRPRRPRLRPIWRTHAPRVRISSSPWVCSRGVDAAHSGPGTQHRPVAVHRRSECAIREFVGSVVSCLRFPDVLATWRDASNDRHGQPTRTEVHQRPSHLDNSIASGVTKGSDFVPSTHEARRRPVATTGLRARKVRRTRPPPLRPPPNRSASTNDRRNR